MNILYQDFLMMLCFSIFTFIIMEYILQKKWDIHVNVLCGVLYSLLFVCFKYAGLNSIVTGILAILISHPLSRILHQLILKKQDPETL